MEFPDSIGFSDWEVDTEQKVVSVYIRKMEKRAKKKIRQEIRTVREIVNSMEHSSCMSIKHF